MQRDWRDYRDPSRERVETPRTQLHTARHFWRASPRATTRTSRPRLLTKNRQDEQLAGVEATFSMRGTGSRLLASTPPRPGQHGWSTVRKREEESAKQAADFRHGQRNGERGSLVGLTCRTRESLPSTDDRQHRQNEQHKCHMAEPANKTADARSGPNRDP